MTIFKKNPELDKMEQLSEYEGEDKVVYISEIEKMLKENKQETKKIYTTFEKLNDLTDGFRQGQLIVISGPIKNGKTTFSMSLANDFIKQKLKLLYFQYELTYLEMLEFYPTIRQYIVPLKKSATTVDWMRERILESICKKDKGYGCDIVFIDNLHYLIDGIDFNKYRNMNLPLVIGKLVRNLSVIAKEFNITIFLICHIEKIEEDKKPKLNHIRESGLIGAEADKIFMVWRKKKKKQDDISETNLSVVDRQTGVLGDQFSLVYNTKTRLLEDL